MDPQVDTFPYVAPCPDCKGMGYYDYEESVIYMWGEREPQVRKITCTTCKGRGKVIPSDWLKG